MKHEKSSIRKCGYCFSTKQQHRLVLPKAWLMFFVFLFVHYNNNNCVVDGFATTSQTTNRKKARRYQQQSQQQHNQQRRDFSSSDNEDKGFVPRCNRSSATNINSWSRNIVVVQKSAVVFAAAVSLLCGVWFQPTNCVAATLLEDTTTAATAVATPTANNQQQDVDLVQLFQKNLKPATSSQPPLPLPAQNIPKNDNFQSLPPKLQQQQQFQRKPGPPPILEGYLYLGDPELQFTKLAQKDDTALLLTVQTKASSSSSSDDNDAGAVLAGAKIPLSKIKRFPFSFQMYPANILPNKQTEWNTATANGDDLFVDAFVCRQGQSDDATTTSNKNEEDSQQPIKMCPGILQQNKEENNTNGYIVLQTRGISKLLKLPGGEGMETIVRTPASLRLIE